MTNSRKNRRINALVATLLMLCAAGCTNLWSEAPASEGFTRHTVGSAFSVELPDDLIMETDRIDPEKKLVASNDGTPRQAQTDECPVAGDLFVEAQTFNAPFELWEEDAEKSLLGPFETEATYETLQTKDDRRVIRIRRKTDVRGCKAESMSTIMELSDKETVDITTYFVYESQSQLDVVEDIHNSLKAL